MKNWLVNIVQGKYRCWDDFRAYGIISAGHNHPASDSLKAIKKNDRIFACLDSKGIIAIGIVEDESILAGSCEIEGDFIAKDESGTSSRAHIKDIMLKRPFMLADSDDPINGEWIVKVKWLAISKKIKKINKLPDIHGAAAEISDNNIISDIEAKFDQTNV